ncbi:Phosphoenolpyruvate transferase [Sinobacterium norvegicum]|uniref:Phosphoenolpyruvate transferase n=1 Tax=Sinobacterium norvegicum TaxID=1641715 RepID=A0ABN8EJG3_9GAMM|nr:2-phospho-L-lactate transferase [Sinobacterium norvegicum]CAH0992601.1 Phosphoenolpyruvate transferase [Sinobacterium norvegicum]
MNIAHDKQVLAVSGGVGGAKLALGLAQVLSAEQLTIVSNTADDFEHLGFSISPDLDTVMYTLAGLNNKELGWGLAGETWSCMESLAHFSDQTWFRLGDKDLATHIYRSAELQKGVSLSRVTEQLCQSLAISHRLLPMTDDRVRTMVQTDQGALAFQHYFVREQCRPVVSGFYFDGIEQAAPQSDVVALLESSSLASIIICPSNPFVSVDPLLKLAGVAAKMAANKAPVIAISPIVGGSAIKGPAAKMFAELGLACTCEGVADFYGELLDGMVIDTVDAAFQPAIEAKGIPCLVTNTVMKSLQDRAELAEQTLAFAEKLSQGATSSRAKIAVDEEVGS